MQFGKRAILQASFLATAIMLSACSGGGGGGSTSATPAAASYPLQSGYRALTANGLSKSFAVSGDCHGSGTRSAGAATAATFEGVSGFASTETVTMTLTDCTPANSQSTSTSYYDSSYAALGMSSVGSDYGVYRAAAMIPVSVVVGDSGSFGTEDLYTDSSKTTSSGYIVQTYAVEADTATTAVFNMISKVYTVAGNLDVTEQSRFRIDANGTLTPLTTDLLYAGNPAMHLLLTYQ